MATVPAIGRAATVASATDATERLYERHHRKVYAFCLYQLRDRDDAAEAAQTTYMHALSALRRGVDPAFELPWLISIARNVCRTRWDAGRRRRRIELVRDPHDLANLAPARETGELLGIEEALAALPEPQRRALVLREWHGLSYQEIADELGVSLSAVETLIFRGRRALAQELGADAKGKRSFGIGSLLGGIKSGVGGSLAAKVAVGVVAAVGVGVAASQELNRPAPTRHAPALADRAEAVSATAPAATPAHRAPSAPARLRGGTAHRPVRAARPPGTTTLRPRATGLTAPAPTAAAATPTVSAGSAPSDVPSPAAGADGAPAGPTTAPSPPSGATPTPAVAPAPVPAPPAITSPQAVVDPVVDPVVDSVVDPVVTPVTNTVTDTATPVVTAVTDAATPVVTTVTDTATPVVSTVTNALPLAPAPVPLP